MVRSEEKANLHSLGNWWDCKKVHFRIIIV
jgi:hypothetical protein